MMGCSTGTDDGIGRRKARGFQKREHTGGRRKARGFQKERTQAAEGRGKRRKGGGKAKEKVYRRLKRQRTTTASAHRGGFASTAKIFEKCLTRQDKEEGLKITSGAELLPGGDTNLHVMHGNTKLVFEYQVSGREKPVIRGAVWRNFIGAYSGPVTVTLFKYEGPRLDIHCEIKVR
ncbi:Uncharacterized protein TCM_006366 [Theobroma cacao]|uniref:Uncharacterized protein n=1 Tax=Theobroma cacao TaxID=3641 RepID=A0A061DY19_THECC|nr:Uncharacterized protein TCM_006366 [Theobroma cacao]